MAFQDKKFLDAEGITHLVRLLDEYPNNQVLGSVIDAIEGELEQKAEKSEIPNVPVQDVQVNNSSVLQNGIANVPVADADRFGVVKVGNGLAMSNNGTVGIQPAPLIYIKAGTEQYNPIAPKRQHEATFYGLAKAAGADMKDIANTTIGVYPDAQKEAIQSMLGITQMLAPTNHNLVASQAYSIGDVFAANGHLYKATAAIAQDEAIIPDTNCVETTMVDESVRDMQVAGSSIVGSGGVANIPIGNNKLGAVKIGATAYGLQILNDGEVRVIRSSDKDLKAGTSGTVSLAPNAQHKSVFYGLSKVAGVDLKDETVTLGTYPEASKTAIKEMLGVQDGLKVVRLI